MTTFIIDTDYRNPRWLLYNVEKSTFLDMYQFETYITGFPDLKYPIFDPKHGFRVEAEVILVFCRIKQPLSFSGFYVHPLNFEGGSP